MKLFEGLGGTAYQDVLWAIGSLIDDHRIHDIRLLEHEDGLLLQGRRSDEGTHGSYHTVLLTDDELRDLVATAYQRAVPPAPPVARSA
jgi:hypothetical protein